MKKRILHIINWIGDRGSEKTCLNAAKAMTDYEHVFLAKHILSKEACEDFGNAGEVIEVLYDDPARDNDFEYPDVTDEYISEKGIDLVVVYLPGDNLPEYLKSLNCKKVLHVLCSKKCMFESSGFEAVTVPSKYAATLNPQLAPEWVYPIVEKLEPTETRQQVIARYFPGVDPEDAMLISRVGSIETVKHVEDSLRVAMTMSHVKNVLFLVAGIGDPRYTDQLFTQYHGPNLVYAGRVSEQEKANINAASLACLYPTEFEAFGYSMAEPMSHGTPVVTYNESACPETVGDGGVAVEFNNLPALLKELVNIIARPHHRRVLGEKAQERWAASFSQESYVERVTEIYERILNA